MVEPFEIVTQAENRTGLLSDPYDLYLMQPETELFRGTEALFALFGVGKLVIGDWSQQQTGWIGAGVAGKWIADCQVYRLLPLQGKHSRYLAETVDAALERSWHQ